MLTPPTVPELEAFANKSFEPTETTFVTSVLDQATVAVWAYTGLETLPDETQKAKIVNWAIMELALWLIVQSENRDEVNSPFSSERIGSYSYSKMVQASSGQNSGLYWLDLLFMNVLTDDESTATWVTSTTVFDPHEGWLSVMTFDDFMDRYAADYPAYWVPTVPPDDDELVAIFEENL